MILTDSDCREKFSNSLNFVSFSLNLRVKIAASSKCKFSCFSRIFEESVFSLTESDLKVINRFKSIRQTIIGH